MQNQSAHESPSRGRHASGARHDAIVRNLPGCLPGVQVTGFNTAVRTHFNPAQLTLLEPLIMWVRPDAYCVEPRDRRLTVIEVEVGHHLDEGKVEVYAKIHREMAKFHWRFGLVRIAAWGAYTEVDLSTVLEDLDYYRALEAQLISDRTTP